VIIRIDMHHSTMTLRCRTAVVAIFEKPRMALLVTQSVASVVSRKDEDELPGPPGNNPQGIWVMELLRGRATEGTRRVNREKWVIAGGAESAISSRSSYYKLVK
jgi:hypothetical protein